MLDAASRSIRRSPCNRQGWAAVVPVEEKYGQTLLRVQAPITLWCKVSVPQVSCTGGIVVKQWLRRTRGAVGMGPIRVAVWAPADVVIGLVIDPDGSMDEMWPAIGA